MIDLANARDALVLYVQDGARAWDVVDGSGTCTALPQDCLAAQPDGGAALVAALADRGVDVAGVPLGAGVTPPSGEPSAQELGPDVWVSPSGEVWVADCEGMSEDECEESGATPGLFADVRAAIG